MLECGCSECGDACEEAESGGAEPGIAKDAASAAAEEGSPGGDDGDDSDESEGDSDADAERCDASASTS